MKKNPGKGITQDVSAEPTNSKKLAPILSDISDPVNDQPEILLGNPLPGKEFIGKEEMLSALQMISAELGAKGQRDVELRIFGSGVLILTFQDSRRLTTDLDAIASSSSVMEIAKRIGGELQFPEDWYNEDVQAFDRPTLEFVEHKFPGCENLRVLMLTPECLFAMKCFASRDRKDMKDIGFLMEKVGIESLKQAEAIFSKYYSDEPMPELAMESVLNNCNLRYE